MQTKIILAGATIIIGCLIASSALAKSDKQFLSDAIKGDNAEITLGQLAAQKGGSDGVRSFGQTLVTDHRKAKDEAAALAAGLEVKISDGIAEEAQQELDKLQHLTGPEFDKEFVGFMAAEHEKDISEFKEKAGEGNRQVPEFAARTLPTLQKHLQLAQSLGGH
jgi:putative membrane protein